MAPGAPCQPSGTQIVQSGSLTTAGPTDRRSRRDRKSLDVDRRRRSRGGAQCDDLDDCVDTRVAISALVLGMELVDRTDRELVALARVATVEGRCHIDSGIRRERGLVTKGDLRLPTELRQRGRRVAGVEP